MKNLRRPLSLRSRLIISSLLLVLLVSGVVGISTQIILSRYVVKQVDDQLEGLVGGGPLSNYQAQPCTASPNPQYGGPDDGFGPKFQDSLFATVTGSTASGEVYKNGACTVLTAADQVQLLALPTNGQAQTITLENGREFRVKATATNYGTTRVAGLSLFESNSILSRLATTMLIVVAIGLVLAALVTFVLIGRTLRPLERVAATARKVAEVPLDRGEVDLAIRVPEGDTDIRTEVGQVGAALNQMLGHVSHALAARHESEMQVRQFVADASHELRTPLAAIRGYAELAGRDSADSETVTHALQRVESESLRMTALVNDLLLLARLDAGRPLAQDQVDLTLLVMDVVSDAQVAGRDHRWQLDLPDEPLEVVGDQSRLHQVLANLLSNARTHTPPGSTVTTGLRLDASTQEVVMTVTDDGPGIDKALQPGIFDRFVRGDSSRSRAAGSTGLGLAIVRAVVSAHRGKVSVQSKPGQTVFSVRLPV